MSFTGSLGAAPELPGLVGRPPTADGSRYQSGALVDVRGRDAELAQIDGWLRAGTQGSAEPVSSGGVLVIEGEPGIGKTTLWGEAVRRARLAGCQLLSCRPVPSDAGLPHVGLSDLLRPVPAGAFEHLPAPQRRPLEVALLR